MHPALRSSRRHSLGSSFGSPLLSVAVLAALGAGLAAAPAQAGPITYLFSGTGSGTVNGAAFSNAAFSFSVTTDTSTISTARFGPGDPSTAAVIANVSLAGFGAGTSLSPLDVFDASGGVAGLNDPVATSHDVLDFAAPQFQTYDLTTSLGPIPATLSTHSPFGTTLGTIDITSVSGGTFTATAAPVPEASTTVSLGLLLALGLGGLGVAAKRKKAPTSF